MSFGLRANHGMCLCRPLCPSKWALRKRRTLQQVFNLRQCALRRWCSCYQALGRNFAGTEPVTAVEHFVVGSHVIV